LVKFIESIHSTTKVHLVLNEKNLGLSKAYNLGISLARSQGFQYLILMDQDSYFLENSIAELYNAYEIMRSQGFNGVVSPTVILKKGNIDSIFSRFFDNTSRRIHKWFENNYVMQSRFAINSGTFLPLNIIKDKTFYDEELFTDGIDILFCYKLTAMKLYIFRSKQSRIIHNEHANFFKIGELILPIFLYSTDRIYHIVHDYLTLFQKTYRSRFFFVLYHLLTMSLSLLINVIFRRNRGQIIRNVGRAIDDWINFH
jgi:rhamnosyltransferase